MGNSYNAEQAIAKKRARIKAMETAMRKMDEGMVIVANSDRDRLTGFLDAVKEHPDQYCYRYGKANYVFHRREAQAA